MFGDGDSAEEVTVGKRIIFLHPDLGIGGAERAVVDMNLALQSKGHLTEIITAHHDPQHCFPETTDGRIRVTVVGDWLPRQIFGRFFALFAYLRMLLVALYTIWNKAADLIVCDQVSACVPLLRFYNFTVLFYCHFPDLLLTQRESFLKKLYRFPLDWVEELVCLATRSARCTTSVRVFSTRCPTSPASTHWRRTERTRSFSCFLEKLLSLNIGGVTSGDFGTIQNRKQSGRSIGRFRYRRPALGVTDARAAGHAGEQPDNSGFRSPDDDVMSSVWRRVAAKTLFLSLNRYERKKNVGLAIQGLAMLRDTMTSVRDDVVLVIAGGYDQRVSENCEYFDELNELAVRLDVESQVIFLRSPTDRSKVDLFKRAACLVYTPDREHFGIVPIEAMYLRCPVIAVRSGGPLETVKDGQTGFLCANTAAEFSRAMGRFCAGPDGAQLSQRLGDGGRRHVIERFSFASMTEQLSHIVEEVLDDD